MRIFINTTLIFQYIPKSNNTLMPDILRNTIHQVLITTDPNTGRITTEKRRISNPHTLPSNSHQSEIHKTHPDDDNTTVVWVQDHQTHRTQTLSIATIL